MPNKTDSMLSKAVPPFLKILSSETGSKSREAFQTTTLFAIKNAACFSGVKGHRKKHKACCKKYKPYIFKIQGTYFKISALYFSPKLIFDFQ